MNKNSPEKKNRLLVIVLLLVITAALVGTYFIIKNSADSKSNADGSGTSDENDESVKLSDYTLADIVSLSFSSDGKGYTLIKTGSVWKISGYPNFPVDQQVADVVASAAASITADRLLETTRVNFPKYGLSSPKITIRVEYTDGTELSIAFGDLNSTVKAYYAHIYGTTEIYLINESLINTLNHELEYFRDEDAETGESGEVSGSPEPDDTVIADTDPAESDA